MSRQVLVQGLEDLVDPSWPPLRHVRRGAERLSAEARDRIARRLDEAAASFPAPGGDHAALRRLCSFLSQVEVIAIEVPLSALARAAAEQAALFERQLEDEVFHALVFARLARHLGGLDRPVREAEDLLDQIRGQTDPRTTAVLLNAIAEAWIENLFAHAATWGAADDVFRMVLVDEARHVAEAQDHAAGASAGDLEAAVRRFERSLFRLAQHPRVVLPILALAGEDGFARLSASFAAVHVRALSSVGLEPDPALSEVDEIVGGLDDAPWAPPERRPQRLEPESMWRRTALQLWDTPRDPVMHGWFDARVDHIPRRGLTPIVVAAVGKVWAEYPRVNRYTWGGALWRPAGVNVGVRVALGDHGEALSTVIVPDADKRSVSDIVRILQAGLAAMNEVAADVEGLPRDGEAEALATILRDDELMGMVPAETVMAPVTVSNVGRAGLHAGFGSMPGALGQSVEIIVGRVEKRPVWRGWRYRPTDVVTIGAGADHRVVDGNHCAEAMRRIEAALSPESVKEILARPDTLARDAKLDGEMLGGLGLSSRFSAVAAACKDAPWWLGWLCWLFKK